MTRQEYEQNLIDMDFTKYCDTEQQLYNDFYYHGELSNTVCWSIDNLLLVVNNTEVQFILDENKSLGHMKFDKA